MKALTALLALAGTAGIGYLAYKKMNDKKEDIEGLWNGKKKIIDKIKVKKYQEK